MSLLNAYNQILNESKNSQEVKGSTLKPGQDLASGFKVNKQEGPKVDSPKEDKEHSVDGQNNGEPKKLKKESTNPFDAIYNKILARENWEAEEEANEQPGFGSPTNHDSFEFSGDQASGEGEIEPSEEGEEGEAGHPMEEVLNALKAAVEALEKVVGGSQEDEEDEEGEDEEDEDHKDSETPEFEEGEEEGEEEPAENFGESTEKSEDDDEDEKSEEGDEVEEDVDAEVFGHALIDLEKLAAGLTNPKNQVVKGAVPVKKGSAQVPKGGKTNAKPTELKGKGENLQAKKNDTGYVKKDKNWYDQ
jgi:hypothetical protein